MSEQLLISGIQAKDEIFETLKELTSNENRIRILLEMDEDTTDREIADKVGVSRRTVINAKPDLEEANLIKETGGQSYSKTLSVLDEPLMKHLIEQRLEEDG